jgi:hypothetical protein
LFKEAKKMPFWSRKNRMTRDLDDTGPNDLSLDPHESRSEVAQGQILSHKRHFLSIPENLINKRLLDKFVIILYRDSKNNMKVG